MHIDQKIVWDQGFYYAPYIPVILKKTIEARSRNMTSSWGLKKRFTGHYNTFCSVKDVIKLSIPWAPVKVTGQDIFAWWCSYYMANEITKDIDKEALEVLKAGINTFCY